MVKYSVIIAAAGRSERYGGREKKAFAKIDGRPIFLRSIELFLNRDDVCQTILAVAPEDLDTVKSSYGPNLGFMGVKLVEGGKSRCETVSRALAVVSEDAEFVAVHDAARPCVTDDMIAGVFSEAAKTGAAILAAPITGTIKVVGDNKMIERTTSRERLYEAQTPQVFRKDLLLAAYEALGDAGTEVSDDAQVVERTGQAVSVVISDPTNLKITTKGDTALANAILKSRPSKKAPRMGAFEEAQW